MELNFDITVSIENKQNVMEQLKENVKAYCQQETKEVKEETKTTVKKTYKNNFRVINLHGDEVGSANTLAKAIEIMAQKAGAGSKICDIKKALEYDYTDICKQILGGLK